MLHNFPRNLRNFITSLSLAGAISIISVFTVLLAVLYSIYSQLAGESISDFFIFINSTYGRIVAGILLVTIGSNLYSFKYHQQFLYGIVETLFAILFCFYSFYHANFNNRENIQLEVVKTIIPSVYLVVRGVNNIVDGLKSPKYILKSWMESRILPYAKKGVLLILNYLVSNVIIMILLFKNFMEPDSKKNTSIDIFAPLSLFISALMLSLIVLIIEIKLIKNVQKNKENDEFKEDHK